MDVCCPQCQTVYEVDEFNAYSAAISLQCSQCSFVFRLSPPGRSIEENQRRWMIRSSAQGDILYFNTFDVLHRWIMDGSVSGEDSISRTGERWMALKNIGEFAPIFQTVESIAKIADTRTSVPSGASASVSKSNPKPTPASQSEEVVTKIVPSPQPALQPSLQPPPQFRAPSVQSEVIKSQTLPFGIAAAARRETSGQFRSQTPTNPAQTPRTTKPTAPPQSMSAQHRAVPSGLAQDFPAMPAEPDDAWSFGNLEPDVELRERTTSEPTKTWGFYDIHAARRRSKRRRNILIAVSVCVIAGLGAAAFVGQESLKQVWDSTFTPRDVIPLGDLAVAEESANAAENAEDQAENQASSAAISALQTTSSQQVYHALASAEEMQKQQHQEAQAKAGRTAKKQAVADVVVEKPTRSNDLQSVLASARSALERGKPAQARQMYHQASRLDPQNAEAIAGLGWSLLALGNADSARAQFRRAKYRDPSFDGSYIGLGRAERDLGNVEEALKAYEDYLERFPNGPQISIARYQAEELKRQLGR